VGGDLRGRQLTGPEKGLRQPRPTSDRLREAIFNILSHGFEDEMIRGARVLDLFAGTGALGLEAISRGVKFCLFVENDAVSRGLIRQNIDNLGVGGVTRLFRRDATKLGPSGTAGAFSLVFADPPYGTNLAERALVCARDNNWLEKDALIVVEESAQTDFSVPKGFEEIDRRRQGESMIVFLRNGDAAK
ncbi:MAG: 16S rRNA (guanine(966)-N(2))-methyltransferase RsmD, partial [Fimbriimonadaceae bacterium]|nr:16S rRNA (guanine(966)-N(2))-methyltransferase RsmD [Alphaproteobacteria bacterium]